MVLKGKLAPSVSWMKAMGIGVLLVSAGASAQAQSLEQSIQKAFTHVPAIKAQMATIDAAGSAVKVAGSERLPQLQWNLLGTYGKYDNSATRGREVAAADAIAGEDINTNDEFDSYNSELLFTQQLFDFGQVAGRVKVAKAEVSSASAELAALREVIGRNVMVSYLDVLRFNALLGLAQENVSDAEKLSYIIDQQVRLGKTARVDAYLANSQLSAVRFQVASQEGLLHDAVIRYEKLVGDVPGTLIEPVGPKSFPHDLNHALETSYASNSQLEAANHAVSAAYASLKSVKTSRYPNLDLELFFREGENEEAVLGQSDSIGVNLRLSWDLYTGGRLSGEIDRALALLTVAEAQRDDTRRLLDEAVRVSWSNLETSTARLVYLKMQREADEKVYAAYRSQLKTGKRTPLDVFVVRRNLNQSRLAMDDGRYRVITDKYLVKTAMGTFVKDFIR